MTTKVCTKCHVEKPLETFGKDRHAKDGLRSKCKACGRRQSAAYRAANLEKERARLRVASGAWYAANKQRPEYKARCARYKAAWHQANREDRNLVRALNRDINGGFR